MRTRPILSVALLGGTLLLSSCGDEQNPYKDPYKSDIALEAVTIADTALASGDTAQFFAPGTFAVSLMLQAHIDSFSVHVDVNKPPFPTDTMVRGVSSRTQYRYPFELEFADTGWRAIRVTAYRSNGTTVSDSVLLYARSPLNQSDVEGEAGQYIDLATPPVRDPYVFYVWKFSATDSVLNDVPTARKLLAAGFTFANGQLYVKQGALRSMADPFRVTLADTRPPQLTWLSSGLSDDSSHAYTGRLPYYLRVRAEDQATSLTQFNASVGVPDSCVVFASRLWECTWVLPQLAPEGDSLRVVVWATDSRNNTARDTLWLHYSDTIVTLPTVVISDPAQDYERMPSRDMTLRGIIADVFGYDTLLLYAAVDGVPQPGRLVVGQAAADWAYPVHLDRATLDTSLVQFFLVDSGAVAETLHVARRYVIFDSSMVDVTPPYIARIRWGTTDVSDGFYAPLTPLPLTATVYDQGGVDTVTIADRLATDIGSDQYQANVPLLHVREGNTVVVTARDSAANTSSKTRLIYLNRQPRITRLPAFRYVDVGEVYTDSIGAADDDSDSLSASILIQTRADTTIVDADSRLAFSWTPTAADSGQVTIRVQISDGYPLFADSVYTLYVQTSTALVIAHFTTMAAEFPETLMVDRDTLKVGLRIDQPLSAGNFLFSARLVERDEYLLLNSPDTALRWAPTSTYDGAHTLEVVVRSGADSTDTILPLPMVQVVKPDPPVEIHFVGAQSSVTEDSVSHYMGVTLSRANPGPDTITVDYRVAAGATADSASDYTLSVPPRRLRFAPGDQIKNISVYIREDALVEADEKAAVNLIYPGPSGKAILAQPSSHTFWILNDDAAASIDSCRFTDPDGNVLELGQLVRVPIQFNQAASKPVQLTISPAGSATLNQDFVLSVQALTLEAGVKDTAVWLRVVDDSACERTVETVDLTLKAVTPGVVVIDDFYRLNILPSDTALCPRPVLLIHGGTELSLLDKALADSIRNWGREVVTLAEGQFNTVDPARWGAAVLSATLTTHRPGAALQSLGLPVLSGSVMNSMYLGLTRGTFADTGSVSGTSIDVSIIDVGLPGGTLLGPVQITASMERITWIHPANGGEVLATVSRGGVTMPPATGDTLVAIGRFAVGDFAAPARRCTFPMFAPDNGGSEVAVTPAWWGLLKYCLTWTAR